MFEVRLSQWPIVSGLSSSEQARRVAIFLHAARQARPSIFELWFGPGNAISFGPATVSVRVTDAVRQIARLAHFIRSVYGHLPQDLWLWLMYPELTLGRRRPRVGVRKPEFPGEENDT